MENTYLARSHNLEEAQKLGDRILFMGKGKFVNKIADVG